MLDSHTFVSSAKAFFNPAVQQAPDHKSSKPVTASASWNHCLKQMEAQKGVTGIIFRSLAKDNWACGSVKLATSDTLLPLLSHYCSLAYFHTCILGLQDSGKGSVRTMSLCKTGVGHPWGRFARTPPDFIYICVCVCVCINIYISHSFSSLSFRSPRASYLTGLHLCRDDHHLLSRLGSRLIRSI